MSREPPRIVLATRNPAKREQLSQLLAGLPVQPETQPESGAIDVPEDTGRFRDNAARKALAWAQATGRPAIASDGGLTIPALGERWQALLTRRSTGVGENDTPDSDDDRIRRLLEITRALTGDQRRVYWTEAVALATPDGLVGAWEATGAAGMLAESPYRPTGPVGFWADRLRYYPSLGRYHAELTAAARATIGDPWIALTKPLRAAVTTLLSGENSR